MAWRPSELLIEGILDNTENGKVTGWLKFAGMKKDVRLDLTGNFHRDIRGAKIRLRGNGEQANFTAAEKYLESFADSQIGKAGDMTSGRAPADYVEYGYFEWYSQENGRCVIELDSSQVELLSQPIPTIESDPPSRKQQAENMAEFMLSVARNLNISEEMVFATGNTAAVEKAKKAVANNKIRGMKLLPQSLRDKLPEFHSQEDKGRDAIVYAKFFTPDANWTWYLLEGEPVKDINGCEVDFQFFGLVDGHVRELGYFNLSELESVRGPMHLPIERDLYFEPKSLEEIAPEMFQEGK